MKFDAFPTPLGLVALATFAFTTGQLSGGILLNGVHVTPPGTDSNFEYIELRSSTGGVESTIAIR